MGVDERYLLLDIEERDLNDARRRLGKYIELIIEKNGRKDSNDKMIGIVQMFMSER